ncbi:MAG: hypothetical protein WCT02_00955 [Candidatus Paceibacterota bacterium]|jgi:hypothetical protein
MFGIGHYFKRVQNSFTKEVLLRSLIKEAILKVVSVDIPIESISCKNGVVTLKGISSGARSAIFVKKAVILKEVEEKGVSNVKDIR